MYMVLYPSIHPSTSLDLGCSPVRGPDLTLPGHLHQLLWEDAKAFPCQLGYIISTVHSGSSSGFSPSGICLKQPPLDSGRCLGGIQIPKPAQMIPLDVEEQRLYSESLPDN